MHLESKLGCFRTHIHYSPGISFHLCPLVYSLWQFTHIKASLQERLPYAGFPLELCTNTIEF